MEYTPAYRIQGATGNPSTMAVSAYRQVLIYRWVNRGTIVITCSPRGLVFNEETGLHETLRTILWLLIPMR